MQAKIAAALILLVVTTLGIRTQENRDTSFDSNGIRVRYIDAGSGTPVILVHGYTRSIETNWIGTGVFAGLVTDYRVIAYDLPGHGKSGKPHDPSAYGGLGDDPIRLMDHLGIKRAHLLGYSMGGAVAARAAATRPERFITVMLGGHSGLREWEAGDGEFYEKSARELESDVPFRSLVSGAATATKPTEDDVRSASAALAAVNDVKALAALRRGGMRGLYNTRAEAAAIRVPMLMVYGSLDSVPAGRAMLSILPTAKLVVIEDATHASAARRPEFIAAVRQFMSLHK